MSMTNREKDLRIQELLAAEAQYIERIHALEALVHDLLVLDQASDVYRRAAALGITPTGYVETQPADQRGK